MGLWKKFGKEAKVSFADFYSSREQNKVRRKKIEGIEIPEEIRAFTTGTMCFFADGSHPEMTVRFEARRNIEEGGWGIRRFTSVPKSAVAAIEAGIPPGQGDAFEGHASCDFDALRFLSEESAARGFRAGDEGAGHRDMPHWKAVAEAAKQPIDNAGTVQPVAEGQVLADNVIFDDQKQIDIRDSTLPPAIVPVEEQKPVQVKTPMPVKKSSGGALAQLFNAMFPRSKPETLIEVKQGALIEVASPDGKTPLMQAAEGGHMNIVQELLAAGVEVNSMESHSIFSNKIANSALSYAVREGHAEVVRALLAAGANTEVEYSYSQSVPLRLAVEKRRTDIIRILIDAGADLEADSNGNHWTPLMLAAYAGYTDAVRMLIDADANLDVKEYFHKRTPLIQAVREGHTDVVRMLIDAGADLNARDWVHNNALEVAEDSAFSKKYREERREIASLLREAMKKKNSHSVSKPSSASVSCSP